MKKFAILSVAVVLFGGLVSSASARELSKSTLGGLGLGSMNRMSDDDGQTIRGKGTSASVWGGSTASVHGASSSNGYIASSNHNHGSSLAGGANLSAAAAYRHHSLNVAAAGGFSIAYAK